MHTLHLFLCQLKMEETRFNLRIPPNHFGGFLSKVVSKQKKQQLISTKKVPDRCQCSASRVLLHFARENVIHLQLQGALGCSQVPPVELKKMSEVIDIQRHGSGGSQVPGRDPRLQNLSDIV